MFFKSEELQKLADSLHERERTIKAKRGNMLDRNGVTIAQNKPVNTISVIFSQIKDAEGVAKILAEKLELNYEDVLKKVKKRVALTVIKTNVERDLADEIRACNLPGVMIDEDYRRWYPYGTLASQVIGFTGADNQGIIGLEVSYEEYLKGTAGQILTVTDARGIELENIAENRIEPIDGNHLVTTIDVNIQSYVEQIAEKVMQGKSAIGVSIILMNPQNGEILAMANKPDFDLNEPFALDIDTTGLTSEEKQKLLNQIWRNFNISDTYEPGSAFKVVTASAGLEEGVVAETSTFSCPGFRIVEDRRIRCHKVGGHGAQTFVQGIQNSCNPVFMDVGAALGVDNWYKYLDKFGLFDKTGVDLPGEARTIIHKKENVGPVELATMSFGQSFQITPLQLVRAAASVINGGNLVTPHFGDKVINNDGETVVEFEYPITKQSISAETSAAMCRLLESVVSEGTGRRCYVPGFRIGGKTATSEKLPRRNGKYIASFLAFAPADDPQVIALVLVNEPKGIYYGGAVVGPIIQEIFTTVLPYLGIEEVYSERDYLNYNVGNIEVPNLLGLTVAEAKKVLKDYTKLEIEILGEGDMVVEQFPLEGEFINEDSKVILYAE
jgi:stage V sporulation protein D (sporulation-specific penicillin-binding protein)